MRALWKGGIRFGLVYIPIKLYSGVSQHRLDLDMLREGDQCPIQYVRVCKKDGKEVPWENIVKGYKLEDHYVVLDDKDFEKAAVEQDKTLEIFRFVDVKEVSPRYFKKNYLIEPDKQAGKTFNLLRRAMENTGLAGLCKYVIRNREKIGMLCAAENHIYMLEMYWHEDLRPFTEVKTSKSRVKKEELDMAKSLINQMKGAFEPNKYKDEYQERLLKVIKKKSKGDKVKIKSEEEQISDDADNLMEQLKQSLTAIKK